MPVKKRAKGRKKAKTGLEQILKASGLLGMNSGFLPDRGDLGGRLEKIIRSAFPRILESNIVSLIETTCSAVDELGWDRDRPIKKAVAIAKFRALSLSADNAASDLAAILDDTALESSFFTAIVSKPSHSKENVERLDRFRHHLLSDLFWLRSMMTSAVNVVKSAERTKEPEYECVCRIAVAWYKATGSKPARSGNKDADRATGSYNSPFQRFLNEAVSPAIGDAIVRRVTDDFGDLITRFPLRDTPKGDKGS
jgi:hypothetical protein